MLSRLVRLILLCTKRHTASRFLHILQNFLRLFYERHIFIGLYFIAAHCTARRVLHFFFFSFFFIAEIWEYLTCLVILIAVLVKVSKNLRVFITALLVVVVHFHDTNTKNLSRSFVEQAQRKTDTRYLLATRHSVWF